MHAGDKPYVVSPTGQIDVASRGLTLEALNTIVGQLLPAELQAALDEFGAVQYELPAADEFPGQHFTVVAARGGDDVWTEIRRRRVPDDHVPDELFGPTLSAPVAAPQVLSLPAAAPASTFARSDADDLCAETPGFAGATVQMAQEEDDVLLLPGGAELWPDRERLVEVGEGSSERLTLHGTGGARRLRAEGASAFAEASADRRSPGGDWSTSVAEARSDRSGTEAGDFQPSEGEFDIDIDLDADVALEPPTPAPRRDWQPPPPPQGVADRLPPSAAPQPIADLRPPSHAPLQAVSELRSPLAPLQAVADLRPPSPELPPAAADVLLPSPPAQPLTSLPSQPDVDPPSQPDVEPPLQPDVVLPSQPAAVMPLPPAAGPPSGLWLETEREVARLTKEAGELFEAVRAQADTLGMKQKQFEAFDERLRTLQSGVVDAESRMEGLTAGDAHLTDLTEKVDGLSKRFETLFTQADDLTKKQLALEPLHERLGQAHDIAGEATRQLDSLRQSREDLDALRKEIQEFSERHADAARLVEKLGADRLGLEALGERMTAFATLAPELEAKMDAITGKLELIEDGTRKAASLHESVAELDAQISRVSARVPFVEQLEGRLNDLNVLSGDVDRKLEDQLGAHRLGLEAFGERMTAFATLAPELEAKVDAITGKLELIEDGTRKAASLHESVAELDARISRVSARVPFVEQLEGRLNSLNVLSSDVDGKLEDQLARRVELETLKAACDGLKAQMVDAQPTLDGVRDLQTTLVPLVAEVTRLRADIGAAEKRLEGAKFNEAAITDAAIIEQEKRYVALVEAGNTLATKVSEHSRQMQTLAEELARSSKMKDEMLMELDRVQTRQRDATSRIQASEDHLARAENMFNQLEARRSQTALDEKKPEVVPPSPSQPVAVLPSPPDVAPPSQPVAVVTSPPAVVEPIFQHPIRSGEPPPSDPTVSGLERLLRVSAARGASTLYLSSESRPSVRVDGELQTLDDEPVHAAREVESLLLPLVPERSHEALRARGATEWICDIEGVGRVRCMSFHDHRGPGGVFRLMPARSISTEQLGLPRQVQALALEPEGIVLVAGPRSSGKRTLISAFVDLMNRTRRDHVITIEREVNIVHGRGDSFISQREMRGDDEEMLAAARAALREDPDVLVIEDLRTGALMNVALEAAAAGRLVIGGFSAHTATGAIDRIIDSYAPEYRRQAQLALAGSLRGVIVQVLLRKIGGGRLPAREVLLNTPAVSSVIAEGKTSQLPMAIEGGRRSGMMPLNDALVGLVQSAAVEAHEAYRRSADRPGFLAALDRQGIDTSFVERLA